MSDSFEQFILLLTSLKLSERETVQLLERIKRTPPQELVLLTRELRSFVRYQMPMSTYDTPSYPTITIREHNASGDGSVGERVQRLLRDEAGLSTDAAMNLLTDALTAEKLIAERDVPPLSRKSLANWVDRLIVKVPAKEVLRVATLLRNKIAHAPSTGWLKSSR